MVRALAWATAVAAVTVVAHAAAAPAAVTNGRIAYVLQTSEGFYALVTIKPDGSGERRVVRRARHYPRPTLPRFSPGGRRLAFANRAGRPTLPGPLWIATSAGEHVRELPLELDWPFPTGLSWAPGGKRLVMAEARSSEDHRMHVVRVDGSAGRALGMGRQPVWSPDGRWIAYVGDGLWIVRPDGTGGRRITDATAVTAPAFSPSGRRLLFTRMPDGSVPQEWWTIPVAGGAARKIAERSTGGTSFPCPPQWAPDGERLAAMRIDRMPSGIGRRVFVTWDTDGTDERVEFAVPESYTGDQPCDFSWQRRLR